MEILENNSINGQEDSFEEAEKKKRREFFENRIKQIIKEEENGQRTSGHFGGFDIEKIDELTDGDMEMYELIEQALSYPEITKEQVDVLFGLLHDHRAIASADPDLPNNRELFIGFLNNYAGSKVNLKLQRQ